MIYLSAEHIKFNISRAFVLEAFVPAEFPKSTKDTSTIMADELKAAGNKAIAEKNFDEAV